MWATEEAGTGEASAVELTVPAVEGMQFDVVDPESGIPGTRKPLPHRHNAGADMSSRLGST